MDYDDLTLAIEEELTSLKYDIELKPKFIIPELLVATQHFRTLPTALGLKNSYIIEVKLEKILLCPFIL